MSDIILIPLQMFFAVIVIFGAILIARGGLAFGYNLAYPAAARNRDFMRLLHLICVFDPSLNPDEREMLIKEAHIFYQVTHKVLGVRSLPIHRLAILKDHTIEFQLRYEPAFFEPDMDNTLSYAFQRRVEIKRTHAEGDVLMEVHER